MIAQLGAAALASLSLRARAGEPFVFGVVPFGGPGELVARFAPFCAAIERQLGQSGALRSARDYRNFLRRLEGSAFHFAAFPPHFVDPARRAGYRAGWWIPCTDVVELVAAADIPNLDALRGRTVAVPDPLALATLLGQAFLRHAGLADEVRVRPSGNHANVLELVHRRLVPAGFVPGAYRESAGSEAAAVHVLASLPAPLGLVLAARTAEPRLVAALDAVAREVAVGPDAFAQLFPGRDRRLMRVRPGQFAEWRSMLVRGAAEAPT